LGCLIAFFAGFAVVMLLIVAFVFAIFASVMGGAGYTGVVERNVRIQELTVSGNPGELKIVVIPIHGVLIGGGSLWGADPALVLKAMLDAAREDKKVKSIILDVDSPGGGITTSDIMHKAILDFRKQTGVKVVVLMEDTAASGAYYVSCAADHIMAHPTTVTGSIGVVMPLFDASGLLKKIGVADRAVKSGEFKEIGSPFAERTPEEWAKEKEILDNIVGQMYDQFVKVVADGRRLPVEVVKTLADGRIYTAEDAFGNKLIDSTGYEEDAIKKAKELAGLTSAHVVEYSRMRSWTEMLFMAARASNVTVRLGTVADSLGAAEDGLPLRAGERFLYLWRLPAAAPVQ
jgi:protease-4